MGCLGKLCFGITAVIGVVAIILGVALGNLATYLHRLLKIMNKI